MNVPKLCARFLSILLVVASVATASMQATAAERSKRPPAGSPMLEAHAPREILVQYRTGVPATVQQMSRYSVAGELHQRLPIPRTEVLKVAKGTDLATAIEVLEQRPDVVYAEPNYIYEALATPNDPLSSLEWALDDPIGGMDVDAPAAWDVTTGSRDVIVAVADSGVAYDHPDLAENMWTNRGEFGNGRSNNDIDDDGNGYVDDWRGWDWVGRDNNPSDLLGHGTHVAGTIGARGNNGIGIAGVNWDVSIMPLRILEADGTGTAADLASAFLYAARKGAKVVNASLGGPDYSRTMATAIEKSSGTLFVVAAGNEGDDIDTTHNYPCSFGKTNILCVGATNERGRMPSFSNYGDRTVDIAAPGTSILSTAPHVRAVFTETFESNPAARWASGGSRDSWGTGEDSLGAYMTDSPSGRYRNATNSWVESRRAIPLPEATACGLEFSLRMATEPGADGLLVETSRNGLRWEPVTGFSGRSRGWRFVNTDLRGNRDLFLRFRLITNRTVRSDGVQIDNIRIRCATAAYTEDDYTDLSGTSMAAPHAAGAAALLWSLSPNARPNDIRQALIAGATRSPSLVPKVLAGGRLNLLGGLSALAQELGLPEPPAVPPVPIPTPTTSPTAL